MLESSPELILFGNDHHQGVIVILDLDGQQIRRLFEKARLFVFQQFCPIVQLFVLTDDATQFVELGLENIDLGRYVLVAL